MEISQNNWLVIQLCDSLGPVCNCAMEAWRNRYHTAPPSERANDSYGLVVSGFEQCLQLCSKLFTLQAAQSGFELSKDARG